MAPRESECSRTDPFCPSKSAWRELKRPRSVSSPTSVVQKCHINDVVVSTPFSAAFTLKHPQCTQYSDRRGGDPLLRDSAPTGSRFLPLRMHPPRKQTLALGSC